jgi:UDPglucose 6-dehydrogenase
VKVAVLGLWHLGSVTAACVASGGHSVRAWDPNPQTVADLAQGNPPVEEPGLRDLIRSGLASGSLRFERALADAVADADVIWVTFDTPVDPDDRADVESVVAHVRSALPHAQAGALVLSSSQLPVGSIGRIEREWHTDPSHRRLSFACSPENLRLGKAIEVFTKPDRVIVGVRRDDDRARILELLAPFTDRIEWMSVESAEMTKHAVNAFLATSVTFINEIAALCEQTGADAKEVERGLKSEKRIGPHAYLGPGAAFAGGTLARDVVFLRELGRRVQRPTPLMDGVEASNRSHRGWARQRLSMELGGLSGRTVAVWGLTYKPGTDTLRRSTSVELCRWLVEQGVEVRVHDPAVKDLSELAGVSRCGTPLEAAAGADALVVATEWPQYRQVAADALIATMPSGLVIDANRFLGAMLGADPRFRLIAVGQGARQ